MEIAGNCAMVTGAGAGIGRAIAHRLAAEDAAMVVVVDVDPAASAETVAAIASAGGRATAVVADLAVRAEVERAVAAAAEGWMRALDLNLRTPMLAIHTALPFLVRDGGGAVVNIASSAGLGLDVHPGPEYAAAKAGLIRLTACLAPLRERMVRVNCVCPHTVATDAVLAAVAGHTARGEPLPADLQGDLIDVAEVARVVAELVQARAMAGRVIALRGGRPPRLLNGPPGR